VDWINQVVMTLLVALFLVVGTMVVLLVGFILWMLFDLAGLTPFLGITVLLIVAYLLQKRIFDE
jgi:putative flippase GtrA